MKLTLMMLANNHHQHHDQCQVSQEKLAQETEQSERTVRTQLKKLEADGIIKRFRTYDERGGRGEDEYMLIGLTKLSEEEIIIRARAKLPRPYRKDLPVGGDEKAENPTGSMLPLGPVENGTLPAKSDDPSGKSGPPNRQTVAGTYKENRTLRNNREDLTVGDTRARARTGERSALEIALDALEQQIGEAAWASWIRDLRIISHDPPRLVALDRFRADQVRQRFGQRLEDLLGRRIEIGFQNTGARRAPHKAEGAGR